MIRFIMLLTVFIGFLAGLGILWAMVILPRLLSVVTWKEFVMA